MHDLSKYLTSASYTCVVMLKVCISAKNMATAQTVFQAYMGIVPSLYLLFIFHSLTGACRCALHHRQTLCNGGGEQFI